MNKDSRFFFKIAYRGTHFAGWQIQPNEPTVQGEIENQLSKLFGKPTSIVGCGRTDAGVHASEYYFHCDLDKDRYEPDDLLYKLNRMCGTEIAFHQMHEVASDAHARYDARQRAYVYYLTLAKNPFRDIFHLTDQRNFDLDLLNAAAKILLDYKSFYPFCKTNTDVNHYDCTLKESKWLKIDENTYEFHISGNRFLRGMVRLIVGMCLNVMNAQISIEQVKKSLEKQTRLEKNLSVPANGLFLNRIKYAEEINLGNLD